MDNPDFLLPTTLRGPVAERVLNRTFFLALPPRALPLLQRLQQFALREAVVQNLLLPPVS